MIILKKNYKSLQTTYGRNAKTDGENLQAMYLKVSQYCLENKQNQLKNAVEELEGKKTCLSINNTALHRRIQILRGKMMENSRVSSELYDILNDKVKLSCVWWGFYFSYDDMNDSNIKLQQITPSLTIDPLPSRSIFLVAMAMMFLALVYVRFSMPEE